MWNPRLTMHLVCCLQVSSPWIYSVPFRGILYSAVHSTNAASTPDRGIGPKRTRLDRQHDIVLMVLQDCVRQASVCDMLILGGLVALRSSGGHAISGELARSTSIMVMCQVNMRANSINMHGNAYGILKSTGAPMVACCAT